MQSKIARYEELLINIKDADKTVFAALVTANETEAKLDGTVHK